jgi:glycosyltransferase involved in cell wall biosynthesis
MGSLAAQLLRRKQAARRAVRTAHVTLEWGPGFPNFLYRWFFNGWLFPLLLDAEAGVSQAVVDQLGRHPGVSLAHCYPRLVYNAIPQENVRLRVLFIFAGQNPPFDNLMVGTVGWLTAQKDFQCLLDAFALLQREMPGLRLLIVGDGEQRPFLEEKVRRLGSAERVSFLGQRPDVITFLNQIDVFVLPSRWEGLPTVVLECMAAGVPIIASDIPGTRELVSHGVTGWLFPPGQPVRLAETTRYVLHHPPEILRGTQAAASQLDHFTIPTVTALWQLNPQKRCAKLLRFYL